MIKIALLRLVCGVVGFVIGVFLIVGVFAEIMPWLDVNLSIGFHKIGFPSSWSGLGRPAVSAEDISFFFALILLVFLPGAAGIIGLVYSWRISAKVAKAAFVCLPLLFGCSGVYASMQDRNYDMSASRLIVQHIYSGSTYFFYACMVIALTYGASLLPKLRQKT